MSNVAGKAYAINVLTPIPPALTWLQRLIFMASRAIPSTLAGLLGLSLIHFARWVLIKRDQWPEGDRGKAVLDNDYVLFCSNFNGTWDQYIDAFADGIPQGLDLFWYASSKYPQSIPITPFKTYITHNQFHTGYYYNATPGSAQRDIKAALKVYGELKSLAAKHAGSTPDAFAPEYNKALAHIQNCLGSPGFAPVASMDTENADTNRRKFIEAQAAGTSKPAAAAAATQAAQPAAKPARIRFDGGHCFLTVLLPIKTSEVVDKDGLKSSPVHMVRDALSVLPTARQSPATQALPADSPFARCRKTHFARLAVIDDVLFNGRAPSDAIFNPTNRTLPGPVDQLPCPYLLFVLDFDAPTGTEDEVRQYLRDMWSLMGADLDPVFNNCFRYEIVASGDSFASYIIDHQVETTMPFNDYWPGLPPLPALSVGVLLLTVVAVAALVGIGLYWLLWQAGLTGSVAWSRYSLEMIGIVLLSLAAGLAAAYWLIMTRGYKAFPAAPNSDLKSILKALYLQRQLISFIIRNQGGTAAQLHAAFDTFLKSVAVNDTDTPSQAPGTIPPAGMKP